MAISNLTSTPSPNSLPDINNLKNIVNKAIPGAGEAVETLLSAAPEVVSGLQNFAKTASGLKDMDIKNINDITKLPLPSPDSARQLIKNTQQAAKSPMAKDIADKGLDLAAKNPKVASAAANLALPGSGLVVEGLLNIYNNIPGASFIMKKVMHVFINKQADTMAKNAQSELTNLTNLTKR